MDGLGAVFGDHVGGGDAGDGDDEVGGAGVDVWGEHAAGAEVEHCLFWELVRVMLLGGGGERWKKYIRTKVRPWPTVAGKVAAFAFTTPALLVRGEVMKFYIGGLLTAWCKGILLLLGEVEQPV
jgi:hypothetical protein